MDRPSPIRTEVLLAETGMVRRLAQALVRRSDLAHDIAQDVMLVALRQPHPPEHLRGWLAAVTRRLAGKAKQAQRVRSRHEGDAAPPPANEAEQHTTERLQLHRRLTDAVLALPEPYRTAVTLRFFDDLPPRAIAQRVGVSSEVVRKRLQRGLEMLRERLDADFGEREHWLRAFAVVGLLPVGSPWLLLTVLAMNKLALAAAATLAVGVYLAWPRAEPPPTEATPVAAAPAASVSADTPFADGERPADREQRVRAPTQLVPAADCRVVVVDERGQPIDRATVHCWTAGALVAREQATDATGRCGFGAMAGAGGVLVVAEGRYPHFVSLPRCGGSHRIVLPDGASCAGTLSVDGGAGDGWQLWLDGVAFADALPKALQQKVSWRSAEVHCDEQGRFEFIGLPANWRGALRLPQPLWLLRQSGGMEDEHDAMAVQAGEIDLRVATTLLPHVRVRLVWADDGTPVAEAQPTFHGQFDDGTGSVSTSLSGDRDGVVVCGFHSGEVGSDERWRIPANRPALVRVQMNVRAPGSDGVVERIWERRELARGDEFVVQIPRASRLHFLAVDSEGRPVSGAVVQTQGLSEPTGPDGRGTFAVADGTEVLIGAPGHRIAFCQPMRRVAGSEQDPLVYQLLADNSLTLQFVGRDRAPARIRGNLSGDLSFFAGKRIAADIDRAVTGLSATGSGHPERHGDLRRWRTYRCAFVLPGDGAITLHSLEPGQRCLVKGYDAAGNEVANQEIVTPAFGEHATVVVRVQGVSFRLEGCITDRADEPIAGAMLMVGDELRVRTDARGNFDRQGFSRDGLDQITIRANGYVAQQLPRVPLVRDVRLHRQLDAACPVTVRVLDEQGTPQPIAPRLEGGGLHDVYDVLGAGEVRWPNLPADVVTFTCQLGGQTFSVQHDTRLPDAVLRVPVPARLRVVPTGGWPEASREGAWVRAIARPLAAAPPDPSRLLPVTGTQGAAEFCADDEQPQLLVPGSYRIELFENRIGDAGAVERSLGLSAEVTLRAGEDVTAVLK